MATIRDVAKEAGVSVATVSRVVNNSPKTSDRTRTAVNKAMLKLGYRPNANARALVNQVSDTIGVLVADVSDPFFGVMVKEVDHIARQNGKKVLVCNGYHDAKTEREALDVLVNSRCDSMIVHSKGLDDEELIAFAKEIPGMVLCNRYIEQIKERCVALDNQKGAYLAIEFLIRQGHRNIGYLCSNHEIEDSAQRRQGFLDALRDNNLESHESNIAYGEPNERGGEEAMTALLSRSANVTAIACYNDYMAAGAMSVLHDNGFQVPESMSVIGFDDGMIARYLHPKLTTVRYPIQIMAERAITLAMELAAASDKGLSSESQPEASIFTPTLVRRQSVAGHR